MKKLITILLMLCLGLQINESVVAAAGKKKRHPQQIPTPAQQLRTPAQQPRTMTPPLAESEDVPPPPPPTESEESPELQSAALRHFIEADDFDNARLIKKTFNIKLTDEDLDALMQHDAYHDILDELGLLPPPPPYPESETEDVPPPPSAPKSILKKDGTSGRKQRSIRFTEEKPSKVTFEKYLAELQKQLKNEPVPAETLALKTAQKQLVEAAKNNASKQVIQSLIAKGASPVDYCTQSHLFSHEPYFEDCPIMEAINSGSLVSLQAFKDLGFNVTDGSFAYNLISRPSATDEEVASLRWLLKSGMNPNWRGKYATFLTAAAESQQPIKVRILLEAGADPRLAGLEKTISASDKKYEPNLGSFVDNIKTYYEPVQEVWKDFQKKAKNVSPTNKK